MMEQSDVRDNDGNWRRLLRTAYIPCRPDSDFKDSLLAELKAKQSGSTDALDAIGAILKKSYQPVAPRREFETRLLNNLKERQRDTVVLRRSTRRRTLFLSAASSAAAAAVVMFVVWVMPRTDGVPVPALPAAQAAGVSLPVPEAAVAAPAVIPAAYEPGYSTGYRVASAFAGPAFADSATVLRNVAFRRDGERVELAPGVRFRAGNDMGHMEFPDGTLMSLGPNSLLEVTDGGLSVNRGFVLVDVPESSNERFRLHFPERDIAVEPGTELAVMVEDPALFAEGGAPAPRVMVVDRPGAAGGLALAKGRNGVGPLFASQLYRLDRYVTPELPGRTLADGESEDLEAMFKTEIVREKLPMASFAGGFTKDRDLSRTTTVLSPAGFTKKGDAWVADSYAGGPTRKLKYLSDEYFGFANDRRDLARGLALGGSVILDAGEDVFYEIHR